MREVLIGDLAYVQLATVLQIMENEQLSGWVQTRIGTVVLRGGLVVSVDVDGLPAPDAMMRLLDQENGGFIVEAGTPPTVEVIGTVPALLMHAARIKDEWQRVRCLVLSRGTRELPAILAPHGELFDGRRTVEEVVATASLHVSQVVDPITDAMHRQALQHGDAPLGARNAPELARVGGDD